MSERYFVDVLVPDRQTLRRLHCQGLDVFRHTAGSHPAGFVVQGLLTLEEVGRLVDDGCQVVVKEHEGHRARAHRETASFDAWLDAMAKE